MPCTEKTPQLRPKKKTRADQLNTDTDDGAKLKKKQYDATDPIAVLKAGLRTVRHHTAGWLKDDLIAAGKLDGSKNALHAKIWADYNAQQIHIRAQKEIMGEDFDPLRTITGRDDQGQFAFLKTIDVPKNHLSLTYLLYAYDCNASTFKRLRVRGGEPLQTQVPYNKGKTVLSDNDFASTVYTPQYFYVKAEMIIWIKANPQASAQRKEERRKLLRKQWFAQKEATPTFGAAYEKKSRDHKARQKGAQQEVVDLLVRNGRRSYSALGKAMNNWCSVSTIERFLKSQKDFQYYSQNVRPLLSEGNRLKQVAFAKHVHNRWGLGVNRKILWTMRCVVDNFLPTLST